jgi:nucleoside-diphosphate-sugar epimerase
MRILVTGASGFLGLNVVRHLAVAHPQATILGVDLHPPCEHDLGDAEFARLDIRDPQSCRGLLRRAQPTHLLHAAAVTLAESTPESDCLTYAVNHQGAINLLEAAVASGSVERCVILSSSGVYDQQADGPCDEDHPLDPRGAYAQAKRKAELRMTALEASGGFPIVAARVGPVYGRFERSRSTRPRVSLIQQLLDALADGREVRVNGTDMHRDWTHAEDIAAALDGLLFAPELHHRIYNVSTGESVSARQIIALLAERGLRVRWTSDPDAAGISLDPTESRKPLVIARLVRDTGFHPRFDIRAGLADLIAELRLQEGPHA